MTNDAQFTKDGPNPKEARRPNDQSPCLIARKNTRFLGIRVSAFLRHWVFRHSCLALLGARVGFFVGGTEVAGADVRVDLRRDQAFVAEQLLNAADVGAAVQQMRRKTVAEGVRAGTIVEPHLLEMFFEQSANAARSETGTKTIHKDRRTAVRRFFGRELSLGEPGLECAQRIGAERAEAFFASLAADADDALREIEVAIVEADQFAHAQTGGVERFEDRPITKAHRGVTRRGTKQFANFGGREKVRQLVRLARIAERLGWVVVDPVFALSETIKAAERGQLARDRGFGVTGIVQRGQIAAQFNRRQRRRVGTATVLFTQILSKGFEVFSIGLERVRRSATFDEQVLQEF